VCDCDSYVENGFLPSICISCRSSDVIFLQLISSDIVRLFCLQRRKPIACTKYDSIV